MKCCICGKEIMNGRSPKGAVVNGVINDFEGQYCCEECELDYVLPGRIRFAQAEHFLGEIEYKTKDEAISKLTENDVSDKLIAFISTNWERLN